MRGNKFLVSVFAIESGEWAVVEKRWLRGDYPIIVVRLKTLLRRRAFCMITLPALGFVCKGD